MNFKIRNLLIISLGAFLVFLIASAATIVVCAEEPKEIRIVQSFDVPGKLDKVSGKRVTPSGLAWDGQYLWSANWDSQRIYQLNPVTGEIVKFISSPGRQPLGLAWDGQYLWNTDGQTERIYRLNPSNGRTVRTFSLKRFDSYFGYVRLRGMTWDGHYLWCAWYSNDYEEEEDNIYKIDVATLAVVFSVDNPGGKRGSGLAWDGQYLWTIGSNPDYYRYTIYKLNPSTGEIVDSFDYPVRDHPEQPRGLAWDGHYLWSVDTHKIYQLDVTPSPQPPVCPCMIAISSIIPVTLIVARVMKMKKRE